MILRNRIIWSDNGTLKDISKELNNHISGSMVIPFVATEDYLYLGSDAPFNHRWVEMIVANDVASVWTAAIWSGQSWINVAELNDETLDSGSTKTLSVSGRISWVPDKLQPGWSRDDTYTTSGKVITGLSAARIYDLYWLRLTASASLKATMSIAYIGWKFCNDEDIISLWPEFASTEAKDRFKSGITNWDQVSFEAAKQVIRDLKAEQVITSENQIIEWETLRIPAIHKAAQLIYTAYGSDWKDERELAQNEYRKALQADLFNVDLNANATLEIRERETRSGRLTR